MNRKCTLFGLFAMLWLFSSALFAQSVTSMALGADGSSIWAVTSDQNVFRKNGADDPAWTSVVGQKLTQISVGDAGRVIGLTPGGNVVGWNSSTNTWATPLPGVFTRASIGADGTIWVIDAQGVSSYWNGSAWQAVAMTGVAGGKLKEISVATAAAVFGLDGNNGVVQWSGQAWKSLGGVLHSIVAVYVVDPGTKVASIEAWGVNSATKEMWKYRNGQWAKAATNVVGVAGVGNKKLLQSAVGNFSVLDSIAGTSSLNFKGPSGTSATPTTTATVAATTTTQPIATTTVFTTTTTTQASAPVGVDPNFQVYSAVAGNGKVSLSWLNKGSLYRYNIYADITPNITAARVQPILTGLGGTKTEVAGLVNGNVYYFKVAATGPGSYGTQMATNEVSATPLGVLPTPTLKAVAGDGRVIFTWSAVPGATSYTIGVDGTATVVKAGITTTTGVIDGLVNGKPYNAWVKAVSQTAISVLPVGATNWVTPYGSATTSPTSTTQVSGTTTTTLPRHEVFNSLVIDSALAGDGQVELKWRPLNLTFSGWTFSVYADKAPGFSTATAKPLLVNIPPSTTTTKIAGLTNGVKYFFRVVAQLPKPNTTPNDALVSANEVNATPMGVLPVPKVSSVESDDKKAHVSWSAVAGAGSYEIYAEPVGGGTASGGQRVVKTGVVGTRGVVDGLINGHKYGFWVAAVSSTARSPNVGVVDASGNVMWVWGLPNIYSGPVPYLVTAASGNGSVTLKWSNADSGVSIYQGTTAEALSLVKSGLTGSSVAMTGLTNGTKYYFQAQYVQPNGLISSPRSNVLTSIPTASPPATPVLSGTSGVESVGLSWTPVVGATNYQIVGQRVASSAQPIITKKTRIMFTGVNATPALKSDPDNFSLASVQPGTNLTFAVRAETPYGFTDWSNEIKATPLAPMPYPPNPAIPLSQPVINKVVSKDESVELSWTTSTPGAAFYHVYFTDVPGSAYRRANVGSLNNGWQAEPLRLSTPQANVVGLKNGTTYYFRVLARTDAGGAVYSDEISVIPKGAQSLILRGRKAADLQNVIYLSWDAYPGAVTYNVVRILRYSNGVPILDPMNMTETVIANGKAIAATNLTLNGLSTQTNQIYNFRIDALDATGKVIRKGVELLLSMDPFNPYPYQ